MVFLDPSDASIPNAIFDFFAGIQMAPGAHWLGFGGGRRLSPFWGRGGGLGQGTLLNPLPSALKHMSTRVGTLCRLAVFASSDCFCIYLSYLFFVVFHGLQGLWLQAARADHQNTIL